MRTSKARGCESPDAEWVDDDCDCRTCKVFRDLERLRVRKRSGDGYDFWAEIFHAAFRDELSAKGIDPDCDGWHCEVDGDCERCCRVVRAPSPEGTEHE